MEYEGYDLTNPVVYNLVSYLLNQSDKQIIDQHTFVNLVVEIFELEEA